MHLYPYIVFTYCAARVSIQSPTLYLFSLKFNRKQNTFLFDDIDVASVLHSLRFHCEMMGKLVRKKNIHKEKHENASALL